MTDDQITRQAKWRQLFPARYRAHLAVAGALRKGVIEKQPCAECGTTEGRLDAHHSDYNQPLAITWMCRRCHTLLHRGKAK